ncbi:MAG TPA: YihY/virulence factor BrkB family protein [Mycobacteriales bacterium]|nr:YihY/virulence factor BrkB family protein [Mycobacteriales bacterium]
MIFDRLRRRREDPSWLPGRAWRFGRRLAQEASDDRLPGLAAETAFFAVLSVFPALLVAVSLLGLLDVLVGADVAADAQRRVTDGMRLVLTDQAGDAVRAVEELFEDRRGSLLTVATLGALVTLSGGFAVAINALNLAYDADEGRSWVRRRLVGLLLALGSLLLLVLSLAAFVIGPLLGTGQDIADVVGLGAVFTFVWDVLRLPFVVAVLLLWTTTLYRVAPSRHLRWRDALPGAAAAVVLWTLASAGLRLYLDVAADRNPVLSAFGGGIIVMLWMYLLSFALLLGGEVNAVLHERRGRVDDRTDSRQLSLFEC